MPKSHSTACDAWTNSGITEAESYAIVSGELQCIKLKVFVDTFFMHLKAKYPSLYQDHDFGILRWREIPILKPAPVGRRECHDWNLSATSHDKGIVDGIGGMVM